MSSNNSRVSKAAVFGLASVWFGAHVGGGFASGNQGMQFFARFGWPGIFMPILSMVLVGWTAKQVLTFAKNNHVFNYREWSLKAYRPYEKIISILFEISVIILFLLATSSAIAGCASLITNFFDLPYIVGVVGTGAVLLVLSIFGASLFARASSIMTTIIVIALLVVLISGISANLNNLVASFSAGQVRGSAVEIIWAALKYTGFQSFSAIVMIPVIATISSTKEINQGVGLGFILNTVMACLTSAFLVAWMPVTTGETLPVLAVCKSLGQGYLTVIYSVALFFAFVSTAVGALFGCVTRFERVINLNINETVKRIGIAIMFMVISMSISLVGLTKIVAIGYSYVGIIAIFLIVLPMITIGYIRNKKFIEENTNNQQI